MAEPSVQKATRRLVWRGARTLGALSIGALLTSVPVSAAEVVGESVVEGKTVTLFSDETWAYKPVDPQSCSFLSLRVYFCPKDAAWQRDSGDGRDDVVASFRHDDHHYALYTVTKIGASSGRTLKTASFAALTYFEHAFGQKPIVISRTAAQVSGLPAETTVFAVTYEDIPYLYFNTVVLTDRLTVQILNFQFGSPDQVTDADRKLHADIIAATRIEAE